MIVSIFRSLAWAALGAWAYQLLCEAQARQMSVPGAKPAPLQTWEGEGGNVPTARRPAGDPVEGTAPAGASTSGGMPSSAS